MNEFEAYEQLEAKYNEICTTAMINVFSMTKMSFPAIQENPNIVIPLRNFNPKDPEHMFVLSISRALGGILSLQVATDMNPIRRWKMNRKVPKNCRLLSLKKEDKERALDPEELLEFMRPWAAELCELDIEDFDFGDIYYTFYA